LTVYALAKAVVSVLLRTVWRMRVVGAERVPLDGPAIVCANHVSYLDPPALGCAMPRPVYYMAKRELFEIPVLGPLLVRLNAYKVDRARGDVGAIKRSVEVLRSGAAVGIFPEGTRNLDGTVQAQPGVALLHYLSRAPIVPAYIGGTAGAKRLERITVVFGEPLTFATGEKASRDDMAKWTQEIMKTIFALRETIE